MGYCANKPPAKVLIDFKDSKEEVETSSVPVTVTVAKKTPVETEETGDDTAQGNCCDVTYIVKIRYEYCTLDRFGSGECEGESATGEDEAHFTGKLLGIRVSYYNETPAGLVATVKNCEGNTNDASLLGLGTSSKLLSHSIVSIRRADGKPDLCTPPDEDENKCVITVKNSSGGIIYKREAECPIKFKVRCGGECAEGEIKCESNQYPGYCCIDCGDLARALR